MESQPGDRVGLGPDVVLTRSLLAGALEYHMAAGDAFHVTVSQLEVHGVVQLDEVDPSGHVMIDEI